MIRMTPQELAQRGVHLPQFNDGQQVEQKAKPKRKPIKSTRSLRRKANRAKRDIRSLIGRIEAEAEEANRVGLNRGFSVANGKRQRGLYYGMNRDTSGKAGTHIVRID